MDLSKAQEQRGRIHRLTGTRLAVMDNSASGMALEYEGAAAMFAGYVQSAQIVHNLITDSGCECPCAVAANASTLPHPLV